jgi:hypothetical protein
MADYDRILSVKRRQTLAYACGKTDWSVRGDKLA